jgi:hypothetical protein
VDRSLRRLGQLLVVMAAMLGSVLGVSLALIVENAETSRAVGAPGGERAAVLAASPLSSRPPASRAASSQDSVDGAEAADQANQRAGKADKKGESRGDKASGHGKKKPGKGNNK